MTAVIFDCDGTLVDSEPLAIVAWRRAVAPYGYLLSDAEVEACIGMPYLRTHARMTQLAPALPSAAALWPELSEQLFALIDEALVAFPDALATVAELRRRGVPLAVASSSPRERLDRTLAHVGLEFAVTVAGDEVEHGKPAPDMFLAAAAALGVAPQRCVVVEDSAPGIAAGRAAGMPTLAVRRSHPADLGGADRVVDALSADAVLALAVR